MVLAFMLFAGLVFQVACGGSSGTPAGTYTITVTGAGTDADGTLEHSTATMLEVQ